MVSSALLLMLPYLIPNCILIEHYTSMKFIEHYTYKYEIITMSPHVIEFIICASEQHFTQ